MSTSQRVKQILCTSSVILLTHPDAIKHINEHMKPAMISKIHTTDPSSMAGAAVWNKDDDAKQLTGDNAIPMEKLIIEFSEPIDIDKFSTFINGTGDTATDLSASITKIGLPGGQAKAPGEIPVVGKSLEDTPRGKPFKNPAVTAPKNGVQIEHVENPKTTHTEVIATYAVPIEKKIPPAKSLEDAIDNLEEVPPEETHQVVAETSEEVLEIIKKDIKPKKLAALAEEVSKTREVLLLLEGRLYVEQNKNKRAKMKKYQELYKNKLRKALEAQTEIKEIPDNENSST